MLLLKYDKKKAKTLTQGSNIGKEKEAVLKQKSEFLHTKLQDPFSVLKKRGKSKHKSDDSENESLSQSSE